MQRAPSRPFVVHPSTGPALNRPSTQLLSTPARESPHALSHAHGVAISCNEILLAERTGAAEEGEARRR